MKSVLHYYIAFIAMMLAPMSVNAQRGRLLTSDNDLSSSLVTQIIQDQRGLVWISTANGLNFYDNAIKIYKKSNDKGSLKSSNINCMLSDGDKLYVGSAGNLSYFNVYTNTFIPIKLVDGKNVLTNYYVSTILKRRNGDILISTSGLGMYVLKHGQNAATRCHLFDSDNGTINTAESKDGTLWCIADDLYRIKGKKVKRYFSDKNKSTRLSRICIDARGEIFIGTYNSGLFQYDRHTDKFNHIASTGNISITALCAARNGSILIGTDGAGAMEYRNGKTVPCNYYSPEVNLSKTKVASIMEDKDGNTWLGLFQKGVFIQPNQLNKFIMIGAKSAKNNMIGGNCVMSLFMDSRQEMWVGTDNDGLYKVRRNMTSTHYSPGKAGMPATVLCTAEDNEGGIWIGSYMSGVGKLNRNTGEYTPLPFTLHGDALHVFDIKATRNGDLWIATLGDGLKRYNPKTKTLIEYRAKAAGSDCLSNNWVASLSLSHDQKRLYMAMSSGLGCFDIAKNSFVSTFDRNCILDSIVMNYVHVDRWDNLWVGSDNGIYFINMKTRAMKHYTTADGLPDDNISSIEDDQNGNIWISTARGLSFMDKKTQTFNNYYMNDGLQGNEFSMRASFNYRDSLMAFGGNNGITLLYPTSWNNNRKKLSLFLVDLIINNRSVTTETKSGWRQVTDLPTMESKLFKLAYDDNSFEIRLAALDYINPNGVKYMYSINGEEWKTTKQGHGSLLFTHLPAGTYKFRVKAETAGAASDIHEFTIIVRPVWYASVWAYLVYIIIGVLLLLYYMRSLKRREEMHLKIQEHQHAEELNEAKLQFFMNIGHEIRTPMTLIVGPLHKLIATDGDTVRQKTYRLINRNADRILALVNQILDLRKIDKGLMTMQFRDTEIVGFVKDVYDLFTDKASEENVDFVFKHDADKINVWIDSMNFDKVIMNLLSNAFKFTPKGGKVGLCITHDEKELHIEVWDNGKEIPEDKMNAIFNRFYQVDNDINRNYVGTGIGLNLTKQLVQLHHGTITAKNFEDGNGCSFMVTLPMGNAHLKQEEMLTARDMADKETEEPALSEPIEDEGEKAENQQPTGRKTARKHVVLAEDDEEIRNYIEEELSQTYTVTACANGKDAFMEVLKSHPDILLSDVMMPEMDGYTLCAKVKSNINVNSMPVILLTAKTRDEDKLEGLSLGADAYIEKPFNIDILKQVTRNLIKAHVVIKNKVTGQEGQEDKIDSITMKTPDEKLMERVMKVINSNISNPNLSVEYLCEEVGISRSHLHRKMKELTNQGPRDLIRNIRMKQAAALFESGHQNVSEVMYACGFEDSSSFSTKFTAMFGMPPKKYMQLHKKD